MKSKKNSTQQQTSEYKHPWYESVEQLIRDDRGSNHNSSKRVVVYPGTLPAIGPNPPTKEAIAKAQFIDKTYVWTGR